MENDFRLQRNPCSLFCKEIISSIKKVTWRLMTIGVLEQDSHNTIHSITILFNDAG